MTRLEVLFKYGILSSAIYSKFVADDKIDGRGKLTTGEILALTLDIVGGISILTTDKQSEKMLMGISKDLSQKFSKHLVAEWEPGDPICPDPWWMRLKHKHWPPPPPPPESWGEEFFDSDPMPAMKGRASAFNHIQYAYILKSIAGITQLKEFSGRLIESGNSLVKNAADTVYDEYCGTHPPVPPVPGLKTSAKTGVTS